jgi:hypothetical protein
MPEPVSWAAWPSWARLTRALGIDRAAFAAVLSLNSRLSSPWLERLDTWEAELAVHQAQAALPARDRVTDY